MDFSLLMHLRKHLTIKNHTPGSIKIKFSLSLLADPKARALQTEAEGASMPACIKDASLNKLGRTVSITYDPALLDPQKLQEVLTTSDQARFDALADELQSILSA